LTSVENLDFLPRTGRETGTATVLTIWQEGSIDFARSKLVVAKNEVVEFPRHGIESNPDDLGTTKGQMKNV
jgi:hypothetical protein